MGSKDCRNELDSPFVESTQADCHSGDSGGLRSDVLHLQQVVFSRPSLAQ